MLAIALEDVVLADIDNHVQVARRAALRARLAFAGQTNAVAGIDTGRHFDRQGFVLFNATVTVAGVARIGNDLALTMAARAGLLHREEALLHTHLTNAAARRARRWRRAFLRARTIARLAVDQCRNADIHRRAAHRFFQIQLQGVAQVAATLCAATGTTATATEEITETSPKMSEKF